MTRAEGQEMGGSGRAAVLGMAGVCATYFLILLDAGVLNLALPTIQAEWGAALPDVQWVLDGYALPLAALLLISGRVGDRFGHRRVLLAGTGVFLGSSMLAALASSLAWLIAARVGQGAGGAVLLPATLALVPHLFDHPRARARAGVAWVGVGAVAMAVAPLAGGALIAAWGWRSIFAINLPIGLIAFALVAVLVPNAPRRRAPLDLPGQLFALVALGGLSSTAVFAGRDGWASPASLACLGAGVAAAAGFVIVERHSPTPLIPGRYLSDRIRLAAILGAGAVGFCFYGAMLTLSLTLQTAGGQPPLAAGIGLLPLTIATLAGPLLLYRALSRRLRPEQILALGLAVVALGCAGLLAIPAGGALLPSMLLIGAASTTAFSALTALLLAHSAHADIGLGSSLQNASRQAGSLMAYAVAGAMFAVGWHAAASVVLALVAAAASATVIVASRRRSPQKSRNEVRVWPRG